MSHSSSSTLTPALFLSHGGGPCFFMPDGLRGEMGVNSPSAKWFRNLAVEQKLDDVKAIVVISAHWEDSEAVLVNSHASPALLYDYYGFPPDTYKLEYKAPGHPKLAKRIAALINKAGVKAKTTDKRGWDHGVFVPLKLVFPKADIPVVELSLVSTLDPELHYKVGQALRPLREEGVLIVGSGQATHGNAGSGQTKHTATSFVEWMKGVSDLAATTDVLDTIKQWKKRAPGAHASHPREEHLVPWFAVLGSTKPNREAVEQATSKTTSATTTQIYDGAAFDGKMSLAAFRFNN